MLKQNFNYTPPTALSGSLRDYRYPRGADLQARVDGFFKWQNLRRQHGLWPYARSADERPGAVSSVRDDAGDRIRGVDFAHHDYLSLSTHPQIKKAAVEAVETFGVHSAGSAALAGGSAYSVMLERKIADFTGAAEAILFPSGWAAAYGAIKGLVRSTDHVVMDALAHNGLQEGAHAATRNIYLFRHNQIDECRRWLEKIRAKDTENGILVATESLFAMDSDSPDLAALQALCQAFDATLLVDVSHDLGAMGPDGRGVLGEQGMAGKVDLLVGSLSKTFAGAGGFVACQSREVKEYLRFFSPPSAASSALSPVQAAAIGRAFDIVDSTEGAKLRERLMANVLSLRSQLTGAGFELHGGPSPIVCVKLGAENLARLVSRRLPEAGLIANLMEFPTVPKGQARLRLQVMAEHTAQNIADAVAALTAASAAGREEAEWLESEREKLRAAG